MSFTIKIMKVSDRQLGELLANLQLPKGAVYTVEHQANGVVAPKKKGKKFSRRNGEVILTMTGKQPKEGTQAAAALELFEKFEKRRGIGSVTRAEFKEYMQKKELEGMVNRLVNEKFLGYAE